MIKRYLPLFTVITCFAVVPFFGLNAAELWNKGTSKGEQPSKGTAPINPGSLTNNNQSGKYYNSNPDDNSAGVDGDATNSMVRKLKTTPMIVGNIPQERYAVSKSLSGPVPIRKMVSSRVEEFMLSGAMKGRMTDVQRALQVEHMTRKTVRAGAVMMQKENVRIERENAKKHQEYVQEFNRRKNMTNAEILAENQRLYNGLLRDKKSGKFEAMAKRELHAFAPKVRQNDRVSKTKAVSLYNKSR